ncbi:MAG: ACP S-malonyltransferase [Candidatus Omnitrophica bacterium]|nr:ACP S-malonyltransferase [Candidatus Omnitrophota bacterium]
MKNIALVFPGQGAQKVGMGKDLYEKSVAAKAVFDKANEVLGVNLTQVIFEGPEEKLMTTAFCQPAIFTMSMAALAAVKADPKFSGVSVQYAAGLSLGEYGAMCAAGVLSFEESLKLIQKRGAFMEEAAKANPGKMAAIIGFDANKLVEICREAGCEIANFNAPDQIVITGLADKVAKACEMITIAGGKKVIALDVAGAFHSSLMTSAADKFSEVLKSVDLKVTDIKVISNVTARSEGTADEIRINLPKQIFSSVRWVETVQFMAASGIVDIIEIGPGRVLKGLIRKIDPNLNVQNIQTAEDLAAIAL